MRLGANDQTESEVIQGTLVCDCGRNYLIQAGIPHMIYPDALLPSDEEFKQKYDKGAEQYDTGLDWLFKSFYEDEKAVRSGMLDLLNLRPGMRVLEVGCGTGKDSLHIIDRLEGQGELYVLDISAAMIQFAKRRLADSAIPIEFGLSNAAYLPFGDGYFDAAFHFGGLNTFGEVRRALGGKVVVGDEGVAPWLRQKKFGRILINANPLYKHRPPIECLPENVCDVGLRWILGNAFYLIDYRVGTGVPRVDVDLPIPGKGDSLRSRYAARKRR